MLGIISNVEMIETVGEDVCVFYAHMCYLCKGLEHPWYWGVGEMFLEPTLPAYWDTMTLASESQGPTGFGYLSGASHDTHRPFIRWVFFICPWETVCENSQLPFPIGRPHLTWKGNAYQGWLEAICSGRPWMQQTEPGFSKALCCLAPGDLSALPGGFPCGKGKTLEEPEWVWPIDRQCKCFYLARQLQ